jgi:glycosyltransferase involved in cell wall biosynthesis
MIKEIRVRGHDIRLSCGYRDRKKYYGMDEGIIQYFDLPRIRKIRFLFFAASVWRATVKTFLIERPDVLLIDYSVNLITAPLLLVGRVFRKRTKVVLDVRTLPVDVRYFQWTIRWFFVSLFLARLQCDGVTFITEEMSRYCRAHVTMGRMKTGVWTSGVNPVFFDPDRFEKNPAKGTFRIFYHGGLSLSRGIGSLIRAVKLLIDKGCPVDLTLIGNCVDRDAFLKIIKDNGLEKTCRILAPVPYEEVPRLIMDCDLPVIPFPDFIGWRVSSPIKLMEYMAMGKSMVVTDIAAHRDVLDEVDFVFYSKDSRPESLADAVDRAYRKRSDLDNLGRKARETALTGYTWGRQAERLLQFFQSV